MSPGRFCVEALRVVPGGHDQGGRGVGPDAEKVEKLWNCRNQERFDPLVEFGELIIECADAVRQ
jgi:hypothetical protein